MNVRRCKLLKGLHRQMQALKTAGSKHVIVGGSLVSRKSRPADFDGCFDASSLDFEMLNRIEPGLLGEEEVHADLKARDGRVLIASVLLTGLRLNPSRVSAS